uniref:GNAT family N-acetyltransferase n=1 Tax=Pseudomonas fluorescens TaxID=294 RepID=UPI0025B74D8A|nr:GNAT family N-acetyltransferase [Pseudomonas fluorescens]
MNILNIQDLTTLQQSHKVDILRLAKRNSAELMNRPVKPNHPMFGVTSAWVMADIEQQITAFTATQLNSELILIIDTNSKAIAFLTYTLAIDSSTACGLNYVCVDSKYRKQGLMTLMIDHLKSRYTDIALCCFPSLVGVYEKLGFSMCEAVEAQVAMRIGKEHTMKKFHKQRLMDHADVKHASELLATKYGHKKAIKINQIFDAETIQITYNVEAFVRNRTRTV